jgi:hypothetical protein
MLEDVRVADMTKPIQIACGALALRTLHRCQSAVELESTQPE